jgi:hypothetical protein
MLWFFFLTVSQGIVKQGSRTLRLEGSDMICM